MKAASCRSAKAAYLMREAIHRHQSPSVAISRHQSPSVAISRHQSPSMDGLEGSVLGDGHEVIGKEPLE